MKTKAPKVLGNEDVTEQALLDEAAVTIISGKILPIMTAGVIDQVKRLAKPYAKLSEFQQSDLIDTISGRIKAQFHSAMKILRTQQHPSVTVTLDSFSKKGSELVIKLKGMTSDTALLALAHGNVAELVFLDTSAVDDQSMKAPAPEPDAPPLPLPLEPEDDSYKGDDADLASEPTVEMADAT